MGLLSAFATELRATATSFLLLAAGFFGLFGLFCWFQFDRQERNLPRSSAFNIALLFFAFVTAPVYLYRTRAPGKRFMAIASFFLAVLVGWQLSLLSGAIVGLVLKTVLAG